MKKIFTLGIALLSMFALVQTTMALTFTVTVPAGTRACYITGEMNGWNPSATPLTKVNETTYTVDLPTATETQKYQYLSGPDWAYIEKDAAGAAIIDRTWVANDVVVNWASTFIPDEREVTIEALVPASVKVLYLVGSFNGWGSPSDKTKMTFVSEDIDGKVFSIKVFSMDAMKMEFKFVAGPAWAYEQLVPKDNYIYGTKENTVSVVVNSFKEYFDPAKTGTLNITATVPAGTAQVFIQGDHLGWDMANAVEGVKNTDGTFSFTIPMVMSISYRLYNKADWGYPEVDAEGKERPNRTAAYPTDANSAITVIGWLKNISGISKTTEATNNIFSKNNVLTVENVISKVEIFDYSGRMIQSSNVTGTYNSNTLKNGLYIVRVDNASKKVMIK